MKHPALPHRQPRSLPIRWRLLALGASLALTGLLPGCAVVTVAGATAGAAIGVAGAVVATGVKVTGKVVGKTIDVITPD